MAQIKKLVIAGAIGASIMGAADAEAHIVLGDDTVGGIGYHLNFKVHHEGSLMTCTGAVGAGYDCGGKVSTFVEDLDGAGVGSDAVGTVASKSFHDRTYDSDGDTVADTVAGWTHTSKWGMISLGDLVGKGIANVDVTLKLERFGDASTAAGSLLPGLSVWAGIDQDDGNSHWYPNGIDSGANASDPIWSSWWAEDIASNHLASATGADVAQIVIHNLALGTAAGQTNFLTFVMGGNAALGSAGVAQNFRMTVDVRAVPVPGAVWLFGSAIAGMIGFGRRRSAVAA